MTYTQFWQLIHEQQIERVGCNSSTPNIPTAVTSVLWHDSRSSVLCPTKEVVLMLVLQSQVKYSGDKRSVMVTTKATAPGGIRTEKVGLPFDPDLYDHMVEHGVVIEVGYQQLA